MTSPAANRPLTKMILAAVAVAAISGISILTVAATPSGAGASEGVAGAGRGGLRFRGIVQDNSGKPVGGAMVTLSGGSFDGAVTLTTFTGADGRYAVEGVAFQGSLAAVQSSVRVIGYELVSSKQTQVVGRPGGLSGAFVLKGKQNVADQIPLSAWLKDVPDTQERRMFLALCGNSCHGFPTPQTVTFASALNGMSREQRADLWLTESLSMTARFPLIFPERFKQMAARPKTGAEEKSAGGYGLYDEPILKTFNHMLADQIPTKYDEFDIKGFSFNAPLGVSNRTVIREYAMPSDALIRELDQIEGSRDLWAVDYRGGQLIRINQDTGERHLVRVPGEFPGPHTIAPTDDGHFMVALMDADSVARFDPKTEKFDLFQVPPASAVHDIALDYRRHAAYDARGGIWLTLAGLNKLARLDMKSGKVEAFDAPTSNGRALAGIGIYSAVITSDKKHLWYTQLFGGVGSFNVETEKFETYLDFPAGDAPHRMAISDRDIVFVPLSGSGEVVAIDTKSSKLIRRYAMPDRNSAPYNVSWDSKRRLIWIGTSSADLFYTLDPENGVIKAFPLPRKQSFFRMITPDRTTGDIWASYSSYLPAGAAPVYIIRISPGVR